MWSRHIFHHYYYKVCSLHDFEFHFCQTIKMGKYSLLQNTSVAAWTDFHFLFKLTSSSLKLVMLLQWANRLELMARSQTYHRWLRWKWKWTMEIFWKSEVLFCTKAIKLKKFVHIYPLHRPGSNVLFKKVFISSFYQTFFQTV